MDYQRDIYSALQRRLNGEDTTRAAHELRYGTTYRNLEADLPAVIGEATNDAKYVIGSQIGLEEFADMIYSTLLTR